MKKALSLAASIALTLFIFGMSGQSGSASASLSGSVAAFVADVLHAVFPDLDIDSGTLHLLVRKGAHLAEYFLLGASYVLTARAWGLKPWPVFVAGVLVALLDEGSQAFAEGRGPSAVDALLIDAPGFLFGGGLFLLLTRKRSPENNVS